MSNQRIAFSRSNGLTLVEMMAALTVTALIMAVLLGLVTKLSLARDIIKRDMPFEPWKTLLREQLQRDYVGCRSIQIDSRQIKMDGYADFVDAEGMNRQGPCRIEYRIVSMENENWLFREQVNLSGSPPDNSTKELVCRGGLRFRISERPTTDVAPGVLKIGIIPADDGQRDNAVIPVVLLRHGATQ